MRKFIFVKQGTGGMSLIPVDEIGIVTQSHDKVEEKFVPVDNRSMVRVKCIETDVFVQHSVWAIAEAIEHLASGDDVMAFVRDPEE